MLSYSRMIWSASSSSHFFREVGEPSASQNPLRRSRSTSSGLGAFRVGSHPVTRRLNIRAAGDRWELILTLSFPDRQPDAEEDGLLGFGVCDAVLFLAEFQPELLLRGVSDF